MIKRIFWVGIGVAIGVIAVRKLSAAQQNIGPAGLNRAVGRVSDSVHDFTDTVRESMGQREAELRTALGLDAKN